TLLTATLTFGGVHATQALTNTAQLETKVATSETSIRDTTNHVRKESSQEQKKFYTPADYETAFALSAQDSVLSYDEINRLYEMGTNIAETPPGIAPSKYDTILGPLEEKVGGYLKMLEEGKKPETKIDSEELLLYIVLKDKVQSADNNEKRIAIGKEVVTLAAYLKMADEVWLKNDFVRKNDYWFVASGFRFEDGMVDPANDILRLAGNKGYVGVKVPNLESQFPVKQKYPQLPSWAWGWFGLAFPPIRNMLLTKFLRGKSDPSYGQSFGAGIANGLAGVLVLDGIHPLVYPIRMFATPLIIQPLRKYLCGDKDFFYDL
ncbi:hypothetical protein HY643_04475, partial [Candidatus Woesearchaeota archaeon]|nr:hypothetical protein [Candidatus Woesearchaeota archaeon]